MCACAKRGRHAYILVMSAFQLRLKEGNNNQSEKALLVLEVISVDCVIVAYLNCVFFCVFFNNHFLPSSIHCYFVYHSSYVLET